MIRVATTPAALQPKPIIVVMACLPCAPDFLNNRSRLKATRGRYPKSSSNVNSGKKIAIGGSITLTTQAVARYTPSTRNPVSHQGQCKAVVPARNAGQKVSMNRAASNLEGMLAPTIVIQNINANNPSMMGKPQIRLVRMRSSVRSNVGRADWPGPVTARAARRAASA